MYGNMSVNSSSSLNSSFDLLMNLCHRSEMIIYIFSALSIINLLLLPVFILVLYLGFQQWRKQRSTATASTSHSDIFTYHCVAMHLNELFGFTFYFCGAFYSSQDLFVLGFCIWSVTSLGQGLFHILTCVERYLAVVHPVTYLGLKQAGGVKIRNISIGCVWLITFGWLPVKYFASLELNLILYFCSTGFFLIVVSLCSISVLCALKRPGPGDEGGNRERVDQSKQRAFHTILAIMGVLLFRFGGDLILHVMFNSGVVSQREVCVVNLSLFVFGLPSSLVLPLLFLQRAGKLQCCKQNTESG